MTNASILDLSAVRSKAPEPKKYTISEVRSAVHDIRNVLRKTVNVRFAKIQDLLASASSSVAQIQLAPGQPNPLQEKEMEVQYHTACMNRLRDALAAAKTLERLETKPSLGVGFEEVLKHKNEVMGMIVDLIKTDIRSVTPSQGFLLASFKELGGAFDAIED